MIKAIIPVMVNEDQFFIKPDRIFINLKNLPNAFFKGLGSPLLKASVQRLYSHPKYNKIKSKFITNQNHLSTKHCH